MARADVALVVVVVALAGFVGLQLARHPMRSAPAVDGDSTIQQAALPVPRHAGAARSPGGVGASTPMTAPGMSGDTRADTRAAVTGSTLPAPDRDLDDIRARIAAARSTTYIADILADRERTLIRWPDRRATGLRIWVQGATPVRDWDGRYAQMARDAFADWNDADLPMRLDFVLDSATSDVHIVWVDHFPAAMGQRVGETNQTMDQHGWILRAEIAAAIHDSAGRVIPPGALAGILRHEAGHALGLGHSHDRRSKMYPVETTAAIMPVDRATLRLVYQLPPGAVP